MKPLVSVIMPVYNAAPFLQEALNSIVQSTYQPIEIIVVDDGSQDDSLAIAQAFAQRHDLCKVYTQPNAGVSKARNHAIREAQGTYILPVDADDKIAPSYIEHAVAVLEQDPTIRVCSAQARMFGDVNKEWQLPPFSYARLARMNFIPITTLFRKADWEKAGGFCEQEIYREDWDFWISLFELGGSFHRLDEVGLFYRVQHHSRRFSAQSHKRAIVDAINQRHPAFLRQYLHGPLHYHRSWSRLLNIFYRETQVGDYHEWNQGDVIHAQRNTLRRNGQVVIKQFQTPSWWRGLIYGLLVPSKAKRSYRNAQRLLGLTPAPIAYREIRYAGVLRQSYYACELSPCTHTFNELIGHRDFPNRTAILQAIGRTIAQLHQSGAYHADLSGGNILFNEDGSRIDIVDLNRIHWYQHLSAHQRWTNFERLNIDREALTIMVSEYARYTHDDALPTIEWVLHHRWKKHVKQHITHLDYE